jgi:ubiquitin C-terminal hydrolase
VDLFQGQYRNRLECLTCHKVCRGFQIGSVQAGSP